MMMKKSIQNRKVVSLNEANAALKTVQYFLIIENVSRALDKLDKVHLFLERSGLQIFKQKSIRFLKKLLANKYIYYCLTR